MTFDKAKWNEWNSVCHGYCRLGRGRRVEFFVTINSDDPFVTVPRATAIQALDQARELFGRLVKEEPTIKKAAARDITKLLEKARTPGKGLPMRVASKTDGAEWKLVYFRDNPKCPLELEYEFDLATLTALGGRSLVLFVGPDLKYQKARLRSG